MRRDFLTALSLRDSQTFLLPCNLCGKDLFQCLATVALHREGLQHWRGICLPRLVQLRFPQRIRNRWRYVSTISETTHSKLKLRKPSVLFETNLALRSFKLNRPKKLNALDGSMINLLRKEVEVYTALQQHSIGFI